MKLLDVKTSIPSIHPHKTLHLIRIYKCKHLTSSTTGKFPRKQQKSSNTIMIHDSRV